MQELVRNLEKIEVVNKACPLLANIAEEGKAKSQESRQAIKNLVILYRKDIFAR